MLFGGGVLVYTEGHGIHLAANSIANTDPSDLAHLWDEVIGHYVWFGGVALVIASLAWAGVTAKPIRGVVPLTLAVLVGGTYATNALEGGTVPLALVSSAAFVLWGFARRATASRLLVPTFAVSLVMVAAYGAWHRGFPAPSAVGWSLF